MPSLSFKERFIPFIKDGTKHQTIRKMRQRPFKKGDTLYLYYGLRTKFCKKIAEVICRDVLEIIIHPDGKVFVAGKKLNVYNKDLLAYMDGFRSDLAGIRGCFIVMLHWWRQTHELPFKGQIILWE